MRLFKFKMMAIQNALCVGVCLCVAPRAFAASMATTKSVSPPIGTPTAASRSKDREIVHFLNRLAFGPRPNEVENVRKIGVARWIDAQLNPGSIDDSAVRLKLRAFPTIEYSIAQLMLAYQSDQLLQRQRKEARLKSNAQSKGELYVAPKNTMNARQQERQNRLVAAASREGFTAGISMQIVAEIQNAKILRALESKRQLQEVLTDFWANHFNLDIKKREVRTLRLADERDAIRPNVLGKFRTLLGASAHSPAMLIYLDNASSNVETTIRNPNRPDKFKKNRADSNAKPNPYMTDVVSSSTRTDATIAPDEKSDVAKKNTTPILPDMPKTRGGVNENYARELMELHTLGVGGGYSQRDVQEVARCFTGWSIDRETGEFRFYEKRHDKGEKTVLGRRIPSNGGERDGEVVLDILASHPSTARFIATKMCQRLVSDAPPKILTERIAQVFLKSGGDLKAVTRAIVTSPEFAAPTAFRSKIKSPFEYSISAARALDASYVVPNASDNADKTMLIAAGTASIKPNNRLAKFAHKNLARQIETMGEPMYGFAAPTGYSENSQSWVSSGALIARLNFALDLTNGRIPDLKISRAQLFDGLNVDDKAAWLARLENLTLQGDVSASTRKTLASQIAPDAPFDAAKIGALLLGSPDFQRR